MPTYVLKCDNCGHVHTTKANYRHSQIDTEECQQCGLTGMTSVPQGGTGFQLSQRNAAGSIGDARGSGFCSRGRCGSTVL